MTGELICVVGAPTFVGNAAFRETNQDAVAIVVEHHGSGAPGKFRVDQDRGNAVCENGVEHPVVEVLPALQKHAVHAPGGHHLA